MTYNINHFIMIKQQRNHLKTTHYVKRETPRGTHKTAHLPTAKSCAHFRSSHDPPDTTASINMTPLRNRNPNQTPQLNQKAPLVSRQRVVLDLVQKFMVGVTSQLDKRLKQGTKTAQIRLNNLQLLRVREIRELMQQLEEIGGEERGDTRQKRRDRGQQGQSPSSLLGQYVQREQYLKRQLTKIIEQTTREPFRQKSVIEMVSKVGELASQLQRKAEGNSHLQFQSSRVRNYYLSQVQDYREEVRFLHQLVRLRDKDTAHPSFNYSIQVSRNQTGRKHSLVEAEHQSSHFNNRVSQVETVDISKLLGAQQTASFGFGTFPKSKNNNNGLRLKSSGVHLKERAENNPESHQKSKSDILDGERYQLEEELQGEPSLRSELGQVNSRMNELNLLLKESLEQSRLQLDCRQEKIEALNCEGDILEENLGDLNLAISAREQELEGIQQLFFDLSQQVVFKQHQLNLLQGQVAALLEERELEQQNLDLVQSQLQFLGEEVELLEQQLEAKRELLGG